MSFDSSIFKKIDEIKAEGANSIAMGPFGSNIKTDNFVEEGIPVIRGTNLSYGKLYEENYVYLTEKKADELKASNAYRGDIIFTHRGTLGQVGIIPLNSKFERYVVSQSQMKLSCNRNIVNPYFVYYYFKSKYGQHALLANTSTTGVPAISRPVTSLKNISMPVPDISYQNAVVSLLNSIDDKIELNNAINKNLEEMAQALFKRWFIDFEFPNENGEPYKSSGGEFEGSELGLIPKGWRVGSIGEVSDVNLESYSGKEKWNYINYLDTGNITRNRISNIQPLDCKLDKIPSRAKRKVNPNDIVISTVRPNQHHYGMIREPLENMLVSTGFAVITSNRNFPSDLLYLWLTQEDITQKLQSIAEGSTTTYPSIKPADIQTLKIPIPHDQILKELSSVIEAMHKKMWEIQKQNRVLTEISDSLLPKLMSGEIRVPIDE